LDFVLLNISLFDIVMEVCRYGVVRFAIILTMLTCSKLFNYVTVANPATGFCWIRLLYTVCNLLLDLYNNSGPDINVVVKMWSLFLS
jgi:hypothetical protein